MNYRALLIGLFGAMIGTISVLICYHLHSDHQFLHEVKMMIQQSQQAGKAK